MSLAKSFPLSKRHYAHPEGHNYVSASQNYVLSAGHDGIIHAFIPAPLSLSHEELYRWKGSGDIKSFAANHNMLAFIAEDQLILKYFSHGNQNGSNLVLEEEDVLLFEGVGGMGDVLVLSPDSSLIAFKHSTSGIRLIKNPRCPSAESAKDDRVHSWGYKFSTGIIILALAFDPTSSLVCALGHKGELTVFRMPEGLESSQLKELFTLSLPLIKTAGQHPRAVEMHWHGDCIIVPVYQDVFVVRRTGATEWVLEGAPLKGHTEAVTAVVPVEIGGRLCIVSSSLDKSVLLRVFDAKSHGLALPLRQNFLPHAVISMSVIKDRMIACMDAEGHVSVMEVDVETSEVVGVMRKPIWESTLFNEDEEESKAKREKSTKVQPKSKESKKSKNKFIDDEAEGEDDSEGVEDDMDEHTDQDMSMNTDKLEEMDLGDDDLLGDYLTGHKKPDPSTIAPSVSFLPPESKWKHPRVHPNATAWRNKCRILTWNMLAMVASRREGTTAVIEVEFADKRAHRPARFNDEHGWEFAAISEAGLLLGGGKRLTFATLVDTPSVFAPHANWSIELKEDIIAVSCTEMHVVLLTETGVVHVLTSTGVPVSLFSVPSDNFVSMCMHETIIAILSTSDDELSCHLYDFKQQVTESHRVCSVSKDRTLVWAGFSEQGQLAMFDSMGTLLCFNGSLWIPVLKLDESCWPVYITSTELHAVLSTSMPEGSYPDPYPSPLITPVPFSTPTYAFMDNTDFTLAILSSHLPSMLSSIPERERKKTNVAADKCLLELIQMSIKGDEMQRVVDLAKLAILPKTIEMAIQLAKHAQLNSLASRLEFVKVEKFEGKTSAIPEDNSPKDSATAVTHRKRLLAGEFGEAKRHALTFEKPSYSNTLPTCDGMSDTPRESRAELSAVNVVVSGDKDAAGDYRGALTRLAFRKQ